MLDILQEYWKHLLYTDGFKLTGLAMTLWLLIFSAVGGWCLSIFLAVARASSNPYLSWPVWFFTYLFRGTPFYVQLLIIYSGLYSLSIVKETDFLKEFFRSGLNCVMLALLLNTAAYTTEIYAGAIKAVDYGQIEAAQAYGFSRFQIYLRIILPSALRASLPTYCNEVILLLHCTTLAFTVTVPDLLKIVRDINAATYQTFTAFTIGALIYLAVSYTLIALFKQAEKRWLKHLQPAS